MFLNGFILHDEPCTDPYARFCGQTEASASSDPIRFEANIPLINVNLSGGMLAQITKK